MSIIKFEASNGQFEVEEKGAKMSLVVKEMLEVLPLRKLDFDTLKKVVEFCKKHTSQDDDIDVWDQDFKMEIDNFPNLFKLINATDYLHIHDLLEVTIQKSVDMMTNMSVEEVREAFNFPKDDFTVAEEAEICE